MKAHSAHQLGVRIQKWAFCHRLVGQQILSYCLKIWSCQIPTAFDAVKRKWHVVKSNILKMLPWKKGIDYFTLKQCQSTVFTKVECIRFHRFLKLLQLNYKPLMFKMHFKSPLNPFFFFNFATQSWMFSSLPFTLRPINTWQWWTEGAWWHVSPYF